MHTQLGLAMSEMPKQHTCLPMLPANATTLANIGTSDHNPVLIQLDISASRDKPYKRKVWCYEKSQLLGHEGTSFINWTGLHSSKTMTMILRKPAQRSQKSSVMPWMPISQVKQFPGKQGIKSGLMTSAEDLQNGKDVSTVKVKRLAPLKTRTNLYKQEKLLTRLKEMPNETTAWN